MDAPTTAATAQAAIAAAEADPKHELWSQAPEARSQVYRLAFGTAPVFQGDGTVPIAAGDGAAASSAAAPAPQAEALALIQAAEADPSHAFWKLSGEQQQKTFQAAYPPAPATDAFGLGGESTPAAQGAAVEMPGLPDGAPWDAEFVDVVQTTTRDLGVAAGEVQDALKHVVSRVGSEIPTIEKVTSDLQHRWGDAYAANLEAAVTFARALPQSMRNYLDATGFGNDAGLVERFATWGKPMLAALREIERIQGDRDHAANNPGHRDHQRARGQLRDLYRKAYGTRSVEL